MRRCSRQPSVCRSQFAYRLAGGQRQKGHLAQQRHLKLIEQLAGLFEPHTKVLLLGAGEFDGTQLLARLEALGRRYIVRTAKNSLLYDQDLTLRFEELGVGPGGTLGVVDARFTQDRYLPILAVAVWKARCDEPLYLVSNLTCPYLGRDHYAQRGRMECNFSDGHAPRVPFRQKPFGRPNSALALNVSSSVSLVLDDPPDVVGRERDWDKQVHRPERTDLSFSS